MIKLPIDRLHGAGIDVEIDYDRGCLIFIKEECGRRLAKRLPIVALNQSFCPDAHIDDLINQIEREFND